MKNQMWVWVVVAVVVLGGAYMYKSQLKSLLMGSPAPVAQTESTSPAPVATTASELVMTKTDATKGNYLVGPGGMTLYSKDGDTATTSSCTGNCLTLWPAYTAATAQATMPANMTTLTRADGTMQYVYKGVPLYYYAKDAKAGDITGDGVGGVWHLVKP